MTCYEESRFSAPVVRWEKMRNPLLAVLVVISTLTSGWCFLKSLNPKYDADKSCESFMRAEETAMMHYPHMKRDDVIEANGILQYGAGVCHLVNRLGHYCDQNRYDFSSLYAFYASRGELNKAIDKLDQKTNVNVISEPGQFARK